MNVLSQKQLYDILFKETKYKMITKALSPYYMCISSLSICAVIHFRILYAAFPDCIRKEK
jgi:DNA polymerase I-like protein with 3'-5' exonuclease and polymerase domains